MKRRIILGILIFVLIGSIAGGVTYAVNGHQPMRHYKLHGIGDYAAELIENDFDMLLLVGTMFEITNPDCVYPIYIDRVALLNEDGGVEWEGDPGDCEFGDVPDVLGPHEIVYLMDELEPFGPEGWFSFTSEIDWHASRDTCPLAGVALRQSAAFILDGVASFDVSSGFPGFGEWPEFGGFEGSDQPSQFPFLPVQFSIDSDPMVNYDQYGFRYYR